MPFSSGTFSRIYNWVNEQLSSPIEISKLDAQEEDFATALNNCILRDGTGLPTAAMDWNGQNLTNVAAFTATGIVTGGRFVPTSSSVPTNGMYLSAANTLAWSTNTTLRLSLDSSGVLTSTGNMVSPAFVPNGSTVPANGVYLPAANTVGIASNTTLRWSVNSTGNHTIAAPTSGIALAVNGFAGATTFTVQDSAIPKAAWLVGATERAFIQYSEAGVAMRVDSDGSILLAPNNTTAVTLGTAGNVTINAPSSGTALTVNGLAGGAGIICNAAGASFNYVQNTSASATLYYGTDTGTNGGFIGTQTAHQFNLYSNAQVRLSIASAGNVTINAPSSGTALSVTAVSGGLPLSMTDGTVTASATFAGSTLTFGPTSNHGFDLRTNNNSRLSIAAGGAVQINAPASGTGLTVAGGGATITGTVTGTTFSGSGASLTNLDATQLTGTVNTARISGSYTGITAIGAATINDSGGSPFNAGYLGMPQSTNTSLVLTDRGKHILLSGTTNTVTIPSNASVAFEVGSTIVLINDGSGNTTLNITTDTLEWFQGGTSSTGSRTIATKSIVTIVKISSTRWALSGAGIS